MQTLKPQTVDEYISQSPRPAQEKLHELRAILKEVAPHATESLKWGNPVFEDKRILFAYAAFKNHINFMPTPAVIQQFENDLKGYTKGMGSVQLVYDKPLPKDLIKKLASYRVKEVQERDAKWM